MKNEDIVKAIDAAIIGMKEHPKPIDENLLKGIFEHLGTTQIIELKREHIEKCVQWRRTTAEWTNDNPIIAEQYLAVEMTHDGARKLKLGDGITHYNDLPYITGEISEVDWNIIINKPDVFPPEDHTHQINEVNFLTERLTELDNSIVRIDETDVRQDMDIKHLDDTIAALEYVENVEFDDQSHDIVFTFHDDHVLRVNLITDGIIDIDYDPITKELIFINGKGEEVRVPIGDLVHEYTGSNGENIQVDIDAHNVIHAILKAGTIDRHHLTVELNQLFADLENVLTKDDISHNFNEISEDRVPSQSLLHWVWSHVSQNDKTKANKIFASTTVKAADIQINDVLVDISFPAGWMAIAPAHDDSIEFNDGTKLVSDATRGTYVFVDSGTIEHTLTQGFEYSFPLANRWVTKTLEHPEDIGWNQAVINKMSNQKPIDLIDVHTDLQETKKLIIKDAPADNKDYVRNNADWKVLDIDVSADIAAHNADPSSHTVIIDNHNSNGEAHPDLLRDAPHNNKDHVRNDGQWKELDVSADIDKAINEHNSSSYAHTTIINAHNSDPNAHPDLIVDAPPVDHADASRKYGTPNDSNSTVRAMHGHLALPQMTNESVDVPIATLPPTAMPYRSLASAVFNLNTDSRFRWPSFWRLGTRQPGSVGFPDGIPSSAAAFLMAGQYNSTSSAFQVLFATTHMYMRRVIADGTWTEWTRMATMDDIPTSMDQWRFIDVSATSLNHPRLEGARVGDIILNINTKQIELGASPKCVLDGGQWCRIGQIRPDNSFVANSDGWRFVKEDITAMHVYEHTFDCRIIFDNMGQHLADLRFDITVLNHSPDRLELYAQLPHQKYQQFLAFLFTDTDEQTLWLNKSVSGYVRPTGFLTQNEPTFNITRLSFSGVTGDMNVQYIEGSVLKTAQAHGATHISSIGIDPASYAVRKIS